MLGPDSSSYNAYADQRPSSDALELAGRVNEALKHVCTPNCPSVALFRNATAPNLILTVSFGQAKVVYAPQFFTAVHEKYGDGAVIALIAHAIGHALDATTPVPWIKREWPPELRADAWAGCTFAKSNLNTISLRAGLTALSEYAPPSHPSWRLRVQALRQGYLQCGGDGAKFDAGVKRVR